MPPRVVYFVSVIALLVLVATLSFSAAPPSVSQEMDDAFAGRAGAAVLVRVRDGKVIAFHNQHTLAQRVATPGSAIKPFVLELLLDRGAVSPTQHIACRRPLSVGGHALNCSHPREISSFDAVEALAYSCNTFFVTAATQLQQGALERRFRELNFTRPTGLLANEGSGQVAAETSLEDRQLQAVGAAGIQVTPMEMASAYLRLARLEPSQVTASQRIVLQGLRAATDFGIAQTAKPSNITVAGKTGTAADPGSSGTHAWFAGFAPADHPEVVIVVFLERGRGSADAGAIAKQILEKYAEQRP